MRNFNFKKEKGAALIMILVFAGLFSIIIGTVAGLSVQQHRLNKQKIAREMALQIAEAGLNYAKWRLAHYPDNLSNEQKAYSDPQGGSLGVFRLEFAGKSQCGNITSINITSTGWTYDYPNTKRIIKAQYARPSIAEYAFLIDDNVWVGEDVEIKGKYHSNKGIRMDGETDSLVTSAVEKWNCTSSFGCNYPYEIKPGIFGEGEGQKQGLWQFPVEPIDFAGISMDLNRMKTLAQSSGLYFREPTAHGYHIILKENGTIDVWNVKSVQAVYAYSLEKDWHWNYEQIKKETFKGNYSLSENCKLIFIEGNLWVEGTVKGKVTIVSADLTNPNKDTDVFLNNNINYSNQDGSDGLAVVAEHDVLIPLYSPNIMELDGIFLAQKGHFGRNHYPWYYWPYYDREKLELHGSIISKGRVGTKWSYYGGGFASGYRKRENTYDRKLMTDPSPFLPALDNEYRFVKWEEVE